MFGSARITEDYMMERYLEQLLDGNSPAGGQWVGQLQDMPPAYRPLLEDLKPGYVELDSARLEIQAFKRIDGGQDRYALIVLEDSEFVPLLGWLVFGGIVALLVASVLSVVLSWRLLKPLEQVVASLGNEESLNASEPANTYELDVLTRRIVTFEDEQRASLRREAGFTRSVSHELRTPITTIVGALDLLEDEPCLPGQTPRLARIRRSIDQLQHTIEALLALSRSEQQVARSTGSFGDALADVVDQTVVDSSLEVVIQAPDNAPHPDWALLIVAIGLLLENVVIHANASQVAINVTPQSATVEDDGIGCAEADTFARNMHTGSNLGYGILHRICERCNWALDVKSSDAGLSVALKFDQPYQLNEA